jgi:aspartate carbamoyltransferase catalytic subunit
MGADAVVIRHGSSGAPARLADQSWMKGSVINAGDGTHEHPSQALLDSFTLRRHLRDSAGDLSGIKVAIVGDILHSRVARSNVLLLKKLGAEVTLVAPHTLLPFGIDQWPVNISYDFDDVLPHVHAVMMLRVQRERMSELFFPSEREYSRGFGLTKERLDRMPKGAVVMHPGPMNRGLEISAEAADAVNSVIVEQVTNGVTVRMAILYLLLGGMSA